MLFIAQAQSKPNSDVQKYVYSTLDLPQFANLDIMSVTDLKIEIEKQFDVPVKSQRLLYGSIGLCYGLRLRVETTTEKYFVIRNGYTHNIMNDQLFEDKTAARNYANIIQNQDALSNYGVRNESTILLTCRLSGDIGTFVCINPKQ